MVRDFMLDMSERDLLLEDKSSVTEPIFDSVWGNIFDEDEENGDVLICNIIVPEAYFHLVTYEDNELTIRFKSTYVPNTNHFRIRLVGLKRGEYALFKDVRGDFGLPAHSFALSRNIAASISASMLPYIDIDGEYLARLVKSTYSEILDKAYIYSAKRTDIKVYFSDDQASQLLTLCAPGKSYRYPTTGVNITKYLNCVVAHSDLPKVLEDQFEADNKPVQSASFDNSSAALDVMCYPEKEQPDSGLETLDNLNSAFFSLFNDEYVRRNVVLNELSDVDFIELLNQYDRVLNLMIFVDSTTTTTRIANNVVDGRFDAEGNVIESADHFVVTTTLEAGSIVMFDDPAQDSVNDSPIFLIDENDETRLYTSLVEQPYWITETCHKCFILKKRATVKYMIEKQAFLNGRGLFVIPQTSENIKNMLGLVQDVHTGRLLGVVSNNTNISDMTLDEVTQHIYATQLIQ